MNGRLALIAAAALAAAACTPPSTSTPSAGATPAASAGTASPKAGATASPTGTPTATASPGPGATPGAGATPTAAPAAGDNRTAAELTVKADGKDVAIGKAFEPGVSGMNIDFDFDKPGRGYAAADKWWLTLGVRGKSKLPSTDGFAAADVQTVTFTLRQGTGATTAERHYNVPMLEASQYAIADGKIDVTYKGTVEKLSVGGEGGAAKIEVELTLKGVSLK